MIVRSPNGREYEVMTACEMNSRCRDCSHYGNDCDGDVDHDPTLFEPCDIEETPWGDDREVDSE